MGAVGSSSKIKGTRLWGVIFIVAVGVVFVGYSSESPGSLDNYPSLTYARTDKSDMDGDGDVDLDDLILFSVDLGLDWQTVDWCQWIEDNAKKERRFKGLFDFIRQYYHCDQPPEDPLAIKNQLLFPTRLAFGSDGKLYVSDAKVGSVFIYDPDLNLIGELKDLNTPLGVGVDDLGSFYVGSDGLDIVEVYDSTGNKLRDIGAGTIKMPNSLAFDQSGILYVADSRVNAVLKFDAKSGGLLGIIGAGELRFPIAVAIAGGELYVADQANNLVRVFDLQGNLVRSLGGNIGQGMMGYKWQGRFVRLQSVAIDGLGRVHALDSHMSRIQILNASSGDYIDSYGTEGTEPGQLRLPLGIALNENGDVAVANAGNHRVELLTSP